MLAHEIGHYRKRHIPKMLAVSAVGRPGRLFPRRAGWRSSPWFYHAFGFEPGSIVPALLLFGLLVRRGRPSGSPRSRTGGRRRYEYQADAFAAAGHG